MQAAALQYKPVGEKPIFEELAAGMKQFLWSTVGVNTEQAGSSIERRYAAISAVQSQEKKSSLMRGRPASVVRNANAASANTLSSAHSELGIYHPERSTGETHNITVSLRRPTPRRQASRTA